MQPLLNASKAWQTIPGGSLKKQESSKNKLSLVSTSLVRWNNFIVKFQNLKQIYMKNYFPANIRLDQDAFRRRLQKTSSRRPDQDEYVHHSLTS